VASINVNATQALVHALAMEKYKALISGTPAESFETTRAKFNLSLAGSPSGSLESLLHHLLGSFSSEEKCNQLQEYLSLNADNEVNTPDKYIGLIFCMEIGISRVAFIDWLTEKKCDYSKWKNVSAYWISSGFPEVREFLSVIIKSPHTETIYKCKMAQLQLHLCDKCDINYLLDNPLPSNFSPEPKLKKQSGKLRVAFVSDKFAINYVSSQEALRVLIFAGLPDDIEVWLFSTKSHADKYTEAYREKSHQFIDISGLSIEESRAIIKKAEIDIALDYVDTSPTQHWELFEDSIRVGVGDLHGPYIKDYYHYSLNEEALYPEWRRKFARLCEIENWYFVRIPATVQIHPEVASVNNKYITFGVFSRLIKIHPVNYDTWATLLNEVPKSRIAFSFIQLDKFLQYIILKEFHQRGISPDRITFFDRTDSEKHLTKYNEVDLIPDTFPVGSSFSATDALWMGVPIVALSRKTDSAGLAIDALKKLGKESWIANNEREYIDICKKLALDTVYRKNLKSTLRQDFINTGIINEEKFSKNMYDCLKRLAENNRD